MKGTTQLGRLEVATYCTNCDDFTIGVPAGETVDRCTACGCFVSDNPDVCCTVHELRDSPYPTGECPYCEQEQRRRDMIEHERTRDPQVEPW